MKVIVNKNKKRYVSDIIGEEYKYWENNDTIFIPAYTGMGKSYFVLHELLPYCVKINKKILYLVNRKILKKQLIEEVQTDVELENNHLFNGTTHSINDYIYITTYQDIERKISQKSTKEVCDFISTFDICIYDECHYFYSDSLFNTYTEISFDYLRTMFDCKIQIFISATIDNIIPIIKNRPPIFTRYYDSIAGLRRFRNHKIFCPTKEKIYLKNITQDYSNYINTKVVIDIKDLNPLIITSIIYSSEKWLIFIDSIKEGKELCKNLNNEIEKYNKKFKNAAVFIDAEYTNREESVTEVTEILKNQKLTKRIIITTPVMYNGISIHDKDLKNMVIMCDTKEDFLQMLGRKRIEDNNNTLTLFILKRDIKHFNNRLLTMEKIYNFYLKHYKNINKMYTLNFYNELLPEGSETIELSPVYCWLHNIQLNSWYQNDILTDILQPNYFNEHEKLCYTLNGNIAFNSFSVNKCKNLILFYKNIIKKLEENSNAFIMEQQHWLNIPDEKINLNIYDFKEEIHTKIDNFIKPFLNKTLDTTENENLRENIRKYLLILLENMNNEKTNKEDFQTEINYLKKNDRCFSEEKFNEIMQLLEWTYRMEKEEQNHFKIYKK
jgi:Type I site-specific restriction-modification system, R (restriction) subunit and related helicases